VDVSKDRVGRGTPLQRRIDFEREHPEVRISTPLEADDGLWHVTWPGTSREPMTFNSAAAMMDRLESLTP
jgi:hypothetical protein